MNRRQALMALSILPLAARAASSKTPTIVVNKSPSCGCCGAWVKHLEQAGFVTEGHNLDDLGPVKERGGVPYSMGSWHTAGGEGYFIEGHVHEANIKRLLVEPPAAKVLTVPGKPAGSPGM